MFHFCNRLALSRRALSGGDRAPRLQRLKFLRDGLEQVALDNVAHLIFAEVSQLDAALEPDPDFFHVVLEPAQRGEPAVVNRLAPPQDPRPRGACDSPIRDEATGDDSL